MNREKRIAHKLAVLKPHYLEIINDSHLHTNHVHSPGLDDSHFTIKISSEELEDKNRIQQHKMINELLKEEYSSGLHALSIKVIKPN